MLGWGRDISGGGIFRYVEEFAASSVEAVALLEVGADHALAVVVVVVVGGGVDGRVVEGAVLIGALGVETTLLHLCFVFFSCAL